MFNVSIFNKSEEKSDKKQEEELTKIESNDESFEEVNSISTGDINTETSTKEQSRLDVIKDIVGVMYEHNLTTQEIRKELTKFKREKERKVPVKWKNPNGDEMWSGRGRRPLWFNPDTAIKLI